jgi:hypothetical protein
MKSLRRWVDLISFSAIAENFTSAKAKFHRGNATLSLKQIERRPKRDGFFFSLSVKNRT